MIDSYFRLEILSNEVRALNKIKSSNRFDCTCFYGDYPGIEPFKNKKGMFFLYLNTASKFIKANKNRISDLVLLGSGLNFTSLYNETNESKYYGYANENFKLKNGQLNPTFLYKNDAYLFRIDNKCKTLEIFILKGQKGMISNIYQMFIDGEFDEEINSLIEQSKPFYNYENK